MFDGVKCEPDVRADVEGNGWPSSNAGRSVGYSGVTIWNPDGKLIGAIRLPEVCGNVCSGGPKAVHGGEPVAIRGLRLDAGRGARVGFPDVAPADAATVGWSER